INTLEKKKLTTKKLSKLSKLQQDYYVFLVNSGGQPFVYSWDVNTGNSQLLVNFIPALSDAQTNYIDGIPAEALHGIPGKS
ncbi:MAG: hypothetical protein WAM14_26665, partial [Candidatus Nitrosopolaris sp.]